MPLQLFPLELGKFPESELSLLVLTARRNIINKTVVIVCLKLINEIVINQVISYWLSNRSQVSCIGLRPKDSVLLLSQYEIIFKSVMLHYNAIYIFTSHKF